MSRKDEIAGIDSRVSVCHSTQKLDDREYDVYISSGRKEERIRLLFVDKGGSPVDVLKDSTMLATKGTSNRAILMFDPHETGALEDANNGFDIKFVHNVITDIRQKSEKLAQAKAQDRKHRSQQVAAWVTFGAAMLSHNFIGSRDVPRYVPAPVEWINDLANRPDHKATSYAEPDVQELVMGSEFTMPSETSYDASGAPSTFFANGSLSHHDGDKPGLWRLGLSYPSGQETKYDKTIVESGIDTTFEEFECSASMSGADCIEALQNEIETVRRDASKNCSTFNIELLPTTKLFTTSDQELSYLFIPEDTLEVCSETGSSLNGTDILIYNQD